MKISPALALAVFLINSAYADVMRIDRSQVNERVDSKYIIIKGPIKTICLDFNNGVKPILNVKNCTYIESARLKNNGSICYKKPNDKRRCYGTRLLDNNMIASGADLRPILIFDSKSKLINAASNLKINTKALSLFNQADILYKNKQHYKAVKLMRKSADLGFSRAQNTYAKALEKGIGIDIDLDQALIWYKKAAEKGLLRAQFNLGKLHQKISKGHLESSKISKEHLESSIKWLKKAAKLGYAKAKDYLANIKIPETIVVNKLEYKNGIAYAIGENKGFSGTYITKHSNGKNKLKINFINGFKDGPSTSWHYNGQKKSLVYYKKNKKEGFETRWHYQGQKAEETNYAHGIKNGLSTEWYENGKKNRETNFVNGKGNRTQWNKLGKKRWAGYVDSSGHIIGTDKNNRPKSLEKKSRGLISTFIGPNSIKTTVYRGGSVAEGTETVFNKRTKPTRYNEKDKDYARYKSRLIEKPIITKLHNNEFVLHPYLERKYSDEFLRAKKLSNSKNKDEKSQGFTELRELARAGMQSAYIVLIFNDNAINNLKGGLVGNLFSPSFIKRLDITIPSNVSEEVDSNPNQLPDQHELFRKFLIVSQKKYQHYNWFVRRGSDEILPLAYKVFTKLGQPDELAELQIVMRATQEELTPIRKYLNSDKDIIENVEKLAKNGDTLAIAILMEIYHPTNNTIKFLTKLVEKNDKKAEFYARLALKKMPEEEKSARRIAYSILEDLKVEDFRIEVQKYKYIESAAKKMAEREVYNQGKYCTVALLEKNQKKRTVYRYDSTDKCLEKIKEVGENGNLNQGRFKNGNNPLIFWGPQGTYEGTKSLMKNHKPLNK